MKTPAVRRSYSRSCIELQQAGLIDAGDPPPMPACRPRYDDPEPLGVNFFRTEVTGDLSDMTLTRTFFGHSEILEASFSNTDLSESTLCWCDFTGVDFSNASLRESDLRASNFDRVDFSACDLRGADLRRASFTNCNFRGAVMTGAKLTRVQADQLGLDPTQRQGLDWQANDGEEPGGG